MVQYHGEQYDQMTISSNGWVSLVPCGIDYFWNMSIPSFMSPKAMLAPFWDDLEVVGQDWIRVYTWYDDVGGRFVIEWSRALNGCLLYTSPSPRDVEESRMPSSA